MPGRRYAATALGLAGVLTVAGCGSGGSGGGSESGGSPKPGGTLTFAVSSDAGCVDPQQVGSNDSIYSTRQLVDSLTDQDPETGKIVPWLASSWKVSDDSRTFTFTLRTGATFSDGSPVDAAAVKANLDAGPELGARAVLISGYLAGYEGTKVVDPQTAEVTFKQPNFQFLQATSTHSLGLVSIASTKKAPDARCTEGVAGSGPFTLAKYVPGQTISLKRRAGYAWGSSLWKKQGEAYLEGLEFRTVPESGVRIGSLQSGEVDAVSSVGPQDEAVLSGGQGVHAQARPNPGIVFNLGLNNSRPLGKDPAVRKAISLAIDRKELVDTVYTKDTRPATSILASTTPLYSDQARNLGFDLEQAKTTLETAGWRPGADGIRVKDGKPLRLDVVWAPVIGTNKPALELLQQQLKLAGIDLQLQELPIAKIAVVQQSHDFDALWGNITRADPDILRTFYSSTGSNVYQLPASGLDRTLDEQAATADEARRKAVVQQAQQQLVQGLEAVPVVELTTTLGVSDQVHDLAFDASSRIQLHDTWKAE